MTIAELKQLIAELPDGMEVVGSRGRMGEVFEIVYGDLMYFAPEAGYLYLKEESIEKDYRKVLVLWCAYPSEGK